MDIFTGRKHHTFRLTFILLCGMTLSTPYAGSSPPPIASQGILDLRTWDFIRDGVVPLRGEWEFFWENLVSPDAFSLQSTPQRSGYFSLPSLWNGYRINGKPLSGRGYATYRMRVLLNSSVRYPLALKFMTANTAYNFFINGKQISVNGIPSTTPEHSTAQYLPHVASYTPAGDTLDMVMHVANYLDYKGGPWKTILMGDETTIRERRERKIAFELFLLGSIIIIGIHYLTIFLLRRKDRVSLYFSLFCFSIAVRTLVIGERYLNHLLPQAPWELMRRLEFWTMHFPTALFCLFIYYLFRQEYQTGFLRFVLISSLLFAGLNLVLPAPLFTYLVLPFEIIIIIAAVHVLYVVSRATLHKREGSIVILGGCILLFLTVINDILYDNCIIQSMRLIPVGLFFLLFSQAILLSKRSANAYTKIENLSTHLTEINTSLKRFVPYEFLYFLEKTNIVEVHLGDQVLKRMAILFSDVRSFTSISEKMTPQENFNFLNSYLEKISPAITTHNGFIDKYVGDAIIALFPETVDDAINAAIDIQKRVEDFNQYKVVHNLPPIAVGVGIHTGSLMLGTIGNANRMETTVISDTVNLASRMEDLTKVYGSSIIISQQMVDLSKTPDAYHYRFLDTVQVKGKSAPVSILEVLDGLPEEHFNRKMETKEIFEEGIKNYQNKNFKQASKQFKTVFDKNESDKAAKFYLNRINYFLQYGAPKDWNGIEVLDYKR